MKKLLIAVFMVSLVMFGAVVADAAVTGTCANCHTMHNSQDGTWNAVNASGVTGPTSYSHLTKSSCIGCHNGSLVIVSYSQPNVFDTANPTAGGAFDTGRAANTQHNPRDVAWSPDEGPLLTVTPGVGDAILTPGGATGLDCAGATGCHGNHDNEGSDLGIDGYHHGSTAYRFLTYGTGATPADIRGKGSSDWEMSGATATNHNVYSAADTDDESDTQTISAFCSQCHGLFHGGVPDTNSNTTATPVWIRHPTEVLVSLASATPTISYTENPMGFDSTSYDTVYPTGAYDMTDDPKVVCVSCHRAHGTPEADILRFTYDTMSAGSTTVTTGCLGCHVAQRGTP